ncbi:hypothetical protein OESDEN_25134 [Oesophagostomum dentatum]|uniref:Uncharacterized protein n=1 Tax=Oesophagostomum dentatum TaxID=61180 RepID=A0A0B1RW39_OESDE|nr:hypothetical protein OESDEN_25134 [Oesophagostomum dentatum]
MWQLPFLRGRAVLCSLLKTTKTPTGKYSGRTTIMFHILCSTVLP